MCQNSDELIDHLLLCCYVAREPWSVISLLRVLWMMPRKVVELLACWKESLVK
jgi:hypothetical protein